MTCKWGFKLLKMIFFFEILYINLDLIVFFLINIFKKIENFCENIIKNIPPKKIP